jgi:hypothetical protein
LSARLIDYDFAGVDIHSHFASLYGVDYKKSKELTFKQLYGGVFKNYKHLEFFQKIEKYVGELWDKFQSDGYVECKVSGYRYEKEKLDNMNPQKLFNYFTKFRNIYKCVDIVGYTLYIEGIQNATSTIHI